MSFSAGQDRRQTCGACLVGVSEDFIQHMQQVDPATNYRCDLLVDTNTVAEALSVGDLLRVGDELGTVEELRRSTKFRYRHARARYTTVLVWWLSQQKLNAGILGNEVGDLLRDKLAPRPTAGGDGTSFTLTVAIMHVVCDYVTRWPFGALTDVDHTLKGTAADSELLRIALRDNHGIVTYEEYTERGIVPNPKKLRSRAQAAGVPVYTPQEYLAANNVDVDAECRRFMTCLVDAVAEAKRANVLDGHAVLDDLVPLYLMILLDEVDDSVAHVVAPPMP